MTRDHEDAVKRFLAAKRAEDPAAYREVKRRTRLSADRRVQIQQMGERGRIAARKAALERAAEEAASGVGGR